MKTLKELLSLKRFRESEAEREVMRAVAELERCERHCHQQEKTLEEFRIYAKETEIAMYDDLCSRMVELGEIEDVQHAVSRLREKEVEHEEEVTKARAAEEAAHEALARARQGHIDAVRMSQKFVELLDQSVQEHDRASLMREEQELDEAGNLGHAHRARART
jgi:type III secretion protein O